MSSTTMVRETKETKVVVELAGGTGRAEVDTGLPFFDHMLGTLARYAGLELKLHARGDLRHHLIEDVATTLGTAVQAGCPGGSTPTSSAPSASTRR